MSKASSPPESRSKGPVGELPGRVETGQATAKAAKQATGGGPQRAELATELRDTFGSALGTDLSDLKLYLNDPAPRRAGAKAITEGRDVRFSPGAYHPENREGRALIAHEMTHVAQQAGPSGQREGASVCTLEQQAESMERSVIDGAALGAGRRVSSAAPQVAAKKTEKSEAYKDAKARGQEFAATFFAEPDSVVDEARDLTGDAKEGFWDGVLGALKAKIGSTLVAEEFDGLDAATVCQHVKSFAVPLLRWMTLMPLNGPKVKTALSAQLQALISGLDAKPSKHTTFRETEALRMGVYEAIESVFGAGLMTAAYEGQQDLFVADQAQQEKKKIAAENEQPYDPATSLNAQTAASLLSLQVTAARIQLQTRMAAEDPQTVLREFGKLVGEFDAAVVTYKRSLKLGSGAAPASHLDTLQGFTTVLKSAATHLNQQRTEVEKKKIQDGTMPSRKQGRDDMQGAEGWDSFHIMGMTTSKRPVARTWSNVSEKRSSGDIDQVVLHEGGRSVDHTFDAWEKDPASSHFIVNPDGTIAQMGPLAAEMDHVGGDNKGKSVGVDLTFYDAQKYNSDFGARNDFMDFYNQSPSQVAAMAKLTLSVNDLSGGGMSLDPQTDKYKDKMQQGLDQSGGGVYPHQSVKDNTHSDPGDMITQQIYKWIPAVEAWEARFGPLDVNDEAELARLKAVIDAADLEVMQANTAEESALRAPVSGTVVSMGTDVDEINATIAANDKLIKKKEKALENATTDEERASIQDEIDQLKKKPHGGLKDPDQHVIRFEQPDGTLYDFKMDYVLDGGMVQPRVQVGSKVDKGEILARYNPYTQSTDAGNSPHEQFKAKVKEKISNLGT